MSDDHGHSWELSSAVCSLATTARMEDDDAGYMTPPPSVAGAPLVQVHGHLSPTPLSPIDGLDDSDLISASMSSAFGPGPTQCGIQLDAEFLASWLQVPTDEALQDEQRRSCGVVQGCVTLIRHAMEAGVAPQLINGVNTGGSYFLRCRSRESVGVFKPEDEEPFAVNNPKKHRGTTDAGSAAVPGIKRGVNVGEGATREVAAFLLDHGGFSRVPPSVLVQAKHRKFHVADTQAADKSALPTKQGSLQLYVPHYCSAEDVSSSLFPADEVHRIGILDIRLFNTDRNADNILVCPTFPEDRPNHALSDSDDEGDADGFSVLAYWADRLSDAATDLTPSAAAGARATATGSLRRSAQVRSEQQGETPLDVIMKARSVSYDSTGVSEDLLGASLESVRSLRSAVSAGLPDRRPVLAFPSALGAQPAAATGARAVCAGAGVGAGAGAGARAGSDDRSPPAAASVVNATSSDSDGSAASNDAAFDLRGGMSLLCTASVARGAVVRPSPGLPSPAVLSPMSRAEPPLAPSAGGSTMAKLPQASPLTLAAPPSVPLVAAAAVGKAATLAQVPASRLQHPPKSISPCASPTGAAAGSSAFYLRPAPPARTQASAPMQQRPTQQRPLLPPIDVARCGGRMSPPAPSLEGGLGADLVTPVRVPGAQRKGTGQRRRPRVSPLLARTSRGAESATFKPRELQRASNIALVPIDHGLSLPHISCLDEAEFGWLYWRQAKQPFSKATLEYIARLDGDADADILRSVLGSRVREGCLATMRLCTELLKRGAKAGLSLFHITMIMVRSRPDTPSMLEQVVSAARRLAVSAAVGSGKTIGANGLPVGMSEREWYDSLLSHAGECLDTAVGEALERVTPAAGFHGWNRVRSTTL